MRTALLIVGILLMLMGLLWAAQGAGVVQWPASSFMLDQRPWITRGAVTVLVGVALIIVSRFRRV